MNEALYIVGLYEAAKSARTWDSCKDGRCVTGYVKNSYGAKINSQSRELLKTFDPTYG